MLLQGCERARAWVAGAGAALLLTACFGARQDADLSGMTPRFRGYVPARIAVLPCLIWPAAARFGALPVTTLVEAEAREFCTRIDDFVIAGFSSQPFMRGLAPSLVQSLALKAGKPQFDEERRELWNADASACRIAETIPGWYRCQLASKPEWRVWLSEFGRMAANADSVLMPFLAWGFSEKGMDRGVLVTRRSASIAMILVDVHSGELIWSGGRDADASRHVLPDAGSAALDPPLPDWAEVYDRLFSELAWQDFPGRIAVQ